MKVALVKPKAVDYQWPQKAMPVPRAAFYDCPMPWDPRDCPAGADVCHILVRLSRSGQPGFELPPKRKDCILNRQGHRRAFERKPAVFKLDPSQPLFEFLVAVVERTVISLDKRSPDAFQAAALLVRGWLE